MQQRATTSSARATQDHSIIHIAQQLQEAKYALRKMDIESGLLPRRSGLHRRLHWVHAIPFIVFLCVFILWWFSYPVNLEVKDGRIAAIHHVEMPLPLNNNHVELAILASATDATAPIEPVPEDLSVTLNNNHVELISLASTTDATAPIAPVPQDLTASNETTAHLMSETG